MDVNSSAVAARSAEGSVGRGRGSQRDGSAPVGVVVALGMAAGVGCAAVALVVTSVAVRLLLGGRPGVPAAVALVVGTVLVASAGTWSLRPVLVRLVRRGRDSERPSDM